MKLARTIAIVTFLLACLVWALMLSAEGALLDKVLPAQVFSATLLLTGGGILLLMNLKRFNRRLKVAYTYIALSLLLVVIGVWQYVFLAIANLLESNWVSFGAADIPFIVSFVLLYLGVRTIAGILLGGKSVLTKPAPTLAVAVIASVAIVAVLGLLLPGAKMSALIAAGIGVFEAIIALVAATLIYKARRDVSKLYTFALSGLFWYCIVTAMGGLNSVVLLGLPAGHWYASYNMGVFFYIAGSITIILTALGFNKAGHAEQVKPSTEETTGKNKASSVDVVIFIASLASQPKSIDAFLDPLRRITVASPSGEQLSKADQQALAGVYVAVEQFLVDHEPLRKYDRESLREAIELRFKNRVNEPAFWAAVSAVA